MDLQENYKCSATMYTCRQMDLAFNPGSVWRECGTYQMLSASVSPSVPQLPIYCGIPTNRLKA